MITMTMTFRITSKAQSVKERIDKLDLTKIKKILLCKRYCPEIKKTRHRLGKNIYKRYIKDKGLISKISKGLLKVNNKKADSQLKNKSKTLSDILPENIYRWQMGI